MKDQIRKEYLNKRLNMSSELFKEYSNRIIDNIKSSIDLNKIDCIAFYMPFKNEVDIKPLIIELLAQNKKIVLPKVIDKKNMEFYLIKDINDVHVGRFNVIEPNSNIKMPKNEIDIIFIPGIAFTYNKYRIGYGAGYYDRYLIDYHNIKVGICFSFQLVDYENHDYYDIPMDLIITESHEHQFRDED